METTREFKGVVSGVDVTTAYDVFGTPAMVFNPELDVEIPGAGSLIGLKFTEDVEEARALVGRRVLVTVEILGEDA